MKAEDKDYICGNCKWFWKDGNSCEMATSMISTKCIAVGKTRPGEDATECLYFRVRYESTSV